MALNPLVAQQIAEARQRGGSWKAELSIILGQYGWRKMNDGRGTVAGNLTKQAREEFLTRFFGELRELGYKVPPSNLGWRHCEMMIQRWIDNGDKPATLQSKISMLRIFSVWIGKEGMIPPNEKLFRGREHLIRRTYVRKEDPRPEAKGVTREELLSRAAAADDRFALILECQLLFGMRREEAICFRPHLADRGSHITFFAQEVGKYTGTKNGVGRHVTVDTAEKRGLLERLKAAVPMGEPLGWHEGTEKGLQKSIKKYANLATRIGMTKREMGFTGHSLRATALVDSAMRDGLPVPVLGESAEGMSPEELDVKRRRLSNQAGHARPQITDAYIGAFVKGRKVASPSLDLFADTDGSANGGSADGEVDARRGEAGDQNQSPPV